jgi:hypothetical protein
MAVNVTIRDLRTTPPRNMGQPCQGCLHNHLPALATLTIEMDSISAEWTHECEDDPVNFPGWKSRTTYTVSYTLPALTLTRRLLGWGDEARTLGTGEWELLAQGCSKELLFQMAGETGATSGTYSESIVTRWYDGDGTLYETGDPITIIAGVRIGAVASVGNDGTVAVQFSMSRDGTGTNWFNGFALFPDFDIEFPLSAWTDSHEMDVTVDTTTGGCAGAYAITGDVTVTMTGRVTGA